MNKTMLLEDGEILQCAICLLEMDESSGYKLPECGHRFHANCIISWFRSKHESCPLCRTHPAVTMKPPDIFQRAKLLIEQQTSGEIDDLFVKERIDEIKESEIKEAQHQGELAQAVRHYKEVLKPRKADILREYRRIRQAFKEETAPMLRMLDKIDSDDTSLRRRLRRLITTEKKKKRTALRAVGLHGLDVQIPQSFGVESPP